jgi:excisionase family DNA binding protein
MLLINEGNYRGNLGRPHSSEILARMTLVEQLRARKKALTVEELADLLGIAVRTLYKEVEDGHVPFFRVRTSIRFDAHQVAEWLEAKMPSQSIRTRRHKEAAAGA